MTDQPSIIQIINSLNNAEEDDIAYVIAATMNLYGESRRRLQGQILYTPNDVRAIFTMIDTLLKPTEDNRPLPSARNRQLSTEESEKLLAAVEGNIKAIERRRI